MTLFYLSVPSATSQKAMPGYFQLCTDPFGQVSVLTETRGKISTLFPCEVKALI